MFIADMHSDSLLTVNSERGLTSKYNVSGKYPYLQFFASFIPARQNPPEKRRRATINKLDVFAYECERLGIVRVDDVRALCYAKDTGTASAMFTIEGGGGLFADSDELLTLDRAGLRIMGFAWDGNELCSSAFDSEDNGLTDEGVILAKKCAELGITVDVSHMSDKSFYDLTEVYPLPIIATHSNFRDVCDNRRNLTRDMARIISARGGVIGLNLYPEFVKRGGARITDLLPHIDYCLEHFGDSCLGFGFDIDGTDGAYPIGIDETSSIHDRVVDMLLAHYPERTVRKIAGENVLDFLKGNI